MSQDTPSPWRAAHSLEVGILGFPVTHPDKGLEILQLCLTQEATQALCYGRALWWLISPRVLPGPMLGWALGEIKQHSLQQSLDCAAFIWDRSTGNTVNRIVSSCLKCTC